MLLGKDGIVPLVTNIATKLARNQFGPRLKVAVEALSNLTKTSKYTTSVVIKARVIYPSKTPFKAPFFGIRAGRTKS